MDQAYRIESYFDSPRAGVFRRRVFHDPHTVDIFNCQNPVLSAVACPHRKSVELLVRVTLTVHIVLVLDFAQARGKS
ncbi:hypothetical protein PV-S19_0418 [Pacmanvirus S19]|nr:hypothetical protein PV-S19_0418 [Pacmanvirus S19]